MRNRHRAPEASRNDHTLSDVFEYNGGGETAIADERRGRARQAGSVQIALPARIGRGTTELPFGGRLAKSCKTALRSTVPGEVHPTSDQQ
jgi:hypothetical protein